MEAPAEIMEEEGYSSDNENPDVVVPPIQKEVWKKDFITVNTEKSPNLATLFNGNIEQPKCLMNNLFTELLTLLGGGSTIDFYMEMGKKVLQS